MRGVALRCMGDLRRAAESYQAAGDICQEYEDLPNWAVAQANLGEEVCARETPCVHARVHVKSLVYLLRMKTSKTREVFILLLCLFASVHDS